MITSAAREKVNRTVRSDDIIVLDNTTQSTPDLLTDLRSIISCGRSQAVASVNSTLTLTYWHVGQRINVDVLQGELAAYGKQKILELAEELVQDSAPLMKT